MAKNEDDDKLVNYIMYEQMLIYIYSKSKTEAFTDLVPSWENPNTVQIFQSKNHFPY